MCADLVKVAHQYNQIQNYLHIILSSRAVLESVKVQGIMIIDMYLPVQVLYWPGFKIFEIKIDQKLIEKTSYNFRLCEL